MSPSNSKARTGRLQLWLGLWILAVFGKLFYLQVVKYSWFEERARQQQSHLVKVSASRGVIYDRNLHPLAMSLTVDAIAAAPAALADPARAAAELAPILGRGRAQLLQRFRSARDFCWVARRVTPAQVQAVRNLHLRGLLYEPENERFYPKGDLAANILGYVGLDGRGLGGAEYEFNNDLKGHASRSLVEVDAHRQVYSRLTLPGQAGDDLVLTIDQNIQYIAQQALDQEVRATHARRGMVVIERPQDGEILALADSPTFDPNQAYATAPALLGNPAVTDVYEPGSVFKLVTISAAMQEGLITPQTVVNCQEGSITIDGHVIHDHAAFGLLTTTQILEQSSDVGAIKVGLKLGEDRFYRYIRAYGFGSKTGIELPGETAGLVRTPEQWSGVGIGAISIGQAIGVTPVQIVAMISTIADGGIYHAPRIVKALTPGTPTSVPAFVPSPGRRIISATVAAKMREMMQQVVLHGTGISAQLDGYSDGGKTGTAQRVDPGGHGYSATDVIASFGGIAPLSHPAIAMLVVIDSPQVRLHDGEYVAGPVFKAIADQVLPYLGVPHDLPVTAAADPSNPVPATAESAEAVTAAPDEESAEAAPTPPSVPVMALPASDLPPQAEPPQAVIPADQLAAAAATAPRRVLVDYNTGMSLPDFTGRTVRQVSAWCLQNNVDLALSGHGAARSQIPAPGTRVLPGAKVAVEFAP